MQAGSSTSGGLNDEAMRGAEIATGAERCNEKFATEFETSH